MRETLREKLDFSTRFQGVGSRALEAENYLKLGGDCVGIRGRGKEKEIKEVHCRTTHNMLSSSLPKKSDLTLLSKVRCGLLRDQLANLQEIFLGTKLFVLFLAITLAIAANYYCYRGKGGPTGEEGGQVKRGQVKRVELSQHKSEATRPSGLGQARHSVLRGRPGPASTAPAYEDAPGPASTAPTCEDALGLASTTPPYEGTPGLQAQLRPARTPSGLQAQLRLARMYPSTD